MLACQDAIHNALATLPLRGVRPMLMQQPLRDPRPNSGLHVEHGTDGIPGHAMDPDLSDRGCFSSIRSSA